MLRMGYTVRQIRKINLEKLIEKLGLGKGEFAIRIETSPSYISQIFSEKTKRNMGDCVARKIETKLGLPKGWMDNLHGEQNAAANKATPVDEEIDGDDDDEPPKPPTPHNRTRKTHGAARGFPETPNDSGGEALLSHIPGYGEPAADSKFPGFLGHELRFPKATLQAMGVDPKFAYYVTALGNSMAPAMPDGALLGVDTGDTAIRDGDIYAIDHAGSPRVKIIYKLAGGGFRLRSFNIQEWPDEHISGETADKIRILGRVFWWSALR